MNQPIHQAHAIPCRKTRTSALRGRRACQHFSIDGLGGPSYGKVPRRLLTKPGPLVHLTHVGLCVLAVFCAGCGGGEFSVAPVSGVVTLDGEPLAGAHVSFEPVSAREDNRAGPGSFGTTDSVGRYQLETLDERNGAVVGNHRITIRTFHAERGNNGEMVITQKEILPDRYHASSELTMEVPRGGTDQANFQLESR